MVDMQNVINGFISFWYTYEGEATLLVLMVLLFKLYINRKATSLDYKKMFVSIPGEITFLVLGFHLSDLVSSTSNSERNITGIIVSLIVLIIQIAVEKDTNDKLSGKLKWNVKATIVLMYIISICLYVKVLMGGNTNG